MAITVVIPNADAAIAVINISYLPLLFISGFFFSFRNTISTTSPTSSPSTGSRRRCSPPSAPSRPRAGGTCDDPLVLLAWGAAALLVALRFFRWMPRRA